MDIKASLRSIYDGVAALPTFKRYAVVAAAAMAFIGAIYCLVTWLQEPEGTPKKADEVARQKLQQAFAKTEANDKSAEHAEHTVVVLGPMEKAAFGFLSSKIIKVPSEGVTAVYNLDVDAKEDAASIITGVKEQNTRTHVLQVAPGVRFDDLITTRIEAGRKAFNAVVVTSAAYITPSVLALAEKCNLYVAVGGKAMIQVSKDADIALLREIAVLGADAAVLKLNESGDKAKNFRVTV